MEAFLNFRENSIPILTLFFLYIYMIFREIFWKERERDRGVERMKFNILMAVAEVRVGKRNYFDEFSRNYGLKLNLPGEIFVSTNSG